MSHVNPAAPVVERPGHDALPAGYRSLWPAVVVAVGVRLIAFFAAGQLEPASAIERIYFSTAAALSSGYGYIMETAAAAETGNGFDPPKKGAAYLQEREAVGGRVDAEHPFPKTPYGWLPATRHPHGYGTLVYLFYSLLNYTGALWGLHILQIMADALACAFLFIFARNVFNARVGRMAAWLYALCPPAIFLSLALLPDAFHGFFISLVLALASFTRLGRAAGVSLTSSPQTAEAEKRSEGETETFTPNFPLSPSPPLHLFSVLLAGAVLGLACHFRTEYILLPGALVFVFWATAGRFLCAVGQTAALAAVMLLILLPWALWMKSVIGEFRFTTTTGGGGLFFSLGEDPQNPWGIVFDDRWLDDDAVRRGLKNPWGPQANRYYGAKFREYLRTYPGRYARIVLFQRLPLALAPPYPASARERKSYDEFNFTKYRTEEGLTRWGVLRKYPFRVLEYMWPQMTMLAYSATLTLCLLGVSLLRWRDWRRSAWLLLPWSYTVLSMSLFKGIEPRNVAPTLITSLAAVAVVIQSLLDRRRPPQSRMNSKLET